tara:strand:- start:545 stop:958 length:414 start_codon:yes stop_codon:yes gene_type:complete
MSNKVKIGIYTASAIAIVSALVLRLRQSQDKAPPDPETSFPEGTETLWIPPGETFKSSVNQDSSGAFFAWDKQDVSGWQFDQGGYILYGTSSILPTTKTEKSILAPGDEYTFIAHNKEDGILLYTNEKNIIEQFQPV